MAKNEYDDIDDLVKDLENEISKEVALNVAEEMKDIMIEVIDEVVYNQYTPREYRRRGEIGGLSDKNNIKEDMKVIKNGISYSTLHKLSNNDTKSISFEVLEKLCTLFNVDVCDMIEIKKDEK